LTVSIWQSDSFDLVETSLLPFIGGVFFAICVIIVGIFGLNSYLKQETETVQKKKNRFLLALGIFIIAFFLFLIIDYLVFLFDNSIPKDYAEALYNIAVTYNSSTAGIDEISDTAFGITNSLITLIMGFIGCMISIPFLKKMS